MAEALQISPSVSGEQKYIDLIPQLKYLVEDEPSLIANLANVAAGLKQTFGLYLVESEKLVLGPFQGEIACSRIGSGKDVCGSASKSEIVIPIKLDEKVMAIIDVDVEGLENSSQIINPLFK